MHCINSVDKKKGIEKILGDNFGQIFFVRLVHFYMDINIDVKNRS